MATLLRHTSGRLSSSLNRLGWIIFRISRDYGEAYAADNWRGVRKLTVRKLRTISRRLSGRGESEQELINASQRYWNDGHRSGVPLEDYSHWFGAGPWRDRERWLKLGRVHFRMYEELCRTLGAKRPLRRAVEWGCGGGANAIHFIGEVDEFSGIDIAPANLKECGRILAEEGFSGFKPVLVAADAPEEAVQATGGGYDFLLSTYVFESLPSKHYGERVLRVARDLLRPGGLALIQIRYDDGSAHTRQKVENYYRYASSFTTYRIEEFWDLARAVGFVPRYVTLVPERTEEYSGDRYAYYAMVRMENPGHCAPISRCIAPSS